MEEYNRLLMELGTDFISRKVIGENYGKSIEELCDLIQLEYVKHTSQIWFRGDIVIAYPSTREIQSAKKTYESVYGAYIGINAKYICYKALLDNLSNGRKYVLQPLRFEPGDQLPMSITELEELEKITDQEFDVRVVGSYPRLVRKIV